MTDAQAPESPTPPPETSPMQETANDMLAAINQEVQTGEPPNMSHLIQLVLEDFHSRWETHGKPYRGSIDSIKWGVESSEETSESLSWRALNTLTNIAMYHEWLSTRSEEHVTNLYALSDPDIKLPQFIHPDTLHDLGGCMGAFRSLRRINAIGDQDNQIGIPDVIGLAKNARQFAIDHYSNK